MVRLMTAAAALLATVSTASAAIKQADAQRPESAARAVQSTTKASTPPVRRATPMSTADDDLRARVVDIQQSLDRILAETTPAAVGTSGTAGGAGTTATDASARGAAVTVDRTRLMQLRQQLEALLTALNRR